MTDGSQPTTATPDELAAVFLRARDTPCPKCAYNRRDGLTAACPECGTGLSLDATPRRFPRALPWIIAPALLIALHDAVWASIFVATDLRHNLERGDPPAPLLIRTTAALALPLGALLCGLVALFARGSPRRRIRFAFIAAMLLLAEGYFARAWSMPDRIHYLQDRLNPAIIWD